MTCSSNKKRVTKIGFLRYVEGNLPACRVNPKPCPVHTCNRRRNQNKIFEVNVWTKDGNRPTLTGNEMGFNVNIFQPSATNPL